MKWDGVGRGGLAWRGVEWGERAHARMRPRERCAGVRGWVARGFRPCARACVRANVRACARALACARADGMVGRMGWASKGNPELVTKTALLTEAWMEDLTKMRFHPRHQEVSPTKSIAPVRGSAHRTTSAL